MCNFAFLWHIFYDFCLQYGEKFLVTKGGSIKCPAGGGIRTLPFRRGVTVPFPPPMPTYDQPANFGAGWRAGAWRVRTFFLLPVELSGTSFGPIFAFFREALAILLTLGGIGPELFYNKILKIAKF